MRIFNVFEDFKFISQLWEEMDKVRLVSISLAENSILKPCT